MWEEPDLTTDLALGKICRQAGYREGTRALTPGKETWGAVVHARAAMQLNIWSAVSQVSAGPTNDATRFGRLA